MRLIAHRRPVLTAAAATANHLDPEPVAAHFLEQEGKPASSANGKGEVKEEQKNDRQAESPIFYPPTTPTRKTGENVGCDRHLIIPVKGLRVPHIDVHHPERVQQG